MKTQPPSPPAPADYSRLGPIGPLMANPRVSELMVMGVHDIYIEVDGKVVLTPINFSTEDELIAVIRHIVEAVGRRIDAESPLCVARRAAGSRVHAAIPPVAIDGPLLNIRKFVRGPLDMADLVRLGSCSETAFGFLKAGVLARANVVVSGGTGSGKTTLLNVLSGYVPDDERIVTMEDGAELQLAQRHVARVANRELNRRHRPPRAAAGRNPESHADQRGHRDGRRRDHDAGRLPVRPQRSGRPGTSRR